MLAFGEGHDELLACVTRRHGPAAQVYRVDNAPTPTATLPVLIDADKHAAEAYHAEHGTLLLVRPDGYLGLVVNRPGSATGQAVDAYLATLGLPSPSPPL